MALSSTCLVPARFLILLANIIILILSIWSRDGNITASLPYDYEDEEYVAKDQELIVGLSLGISFVSFELLGFFSGISMFKQSVNLISIFEHGFACVATSQWFLHSWSIYIYWLIFIIFSIIPFVTEFFVFLRVFFGNSKDL